MTTSGLSVRIWNDAAIACRDHDSYANATAMCMANDKLWSDYKRLDRTQEYIAALTADLGLSADQLIQTKQGGTSELRGTWIHPRLAVDLARWVSPTFAVWMDGWFLGAIANQQPATSKALGKASKASKPCANCGEMIEARPNRKWCSNICRQAGWQQRKNNKILPAVLTKEPQLPAIVKFNKRPDPAITIVADSFNKANDIWYDSLEYEILAMLDLRRRNSHVRELLPNTYIPKWCGEAFTN